MRVLVLGGGGFLGFHAVQSALRAAHEVTVFSRSADAPTPGVRVLLGDRTGDLAALQGQRWDLVVDTFTDPQPGAPAVRRTAQLLSDSVASYVYISGMSVYAPDGPATPDETAPVRSPGVQSDQDPLQARPIAKLAGPGRSNVILTPAALPRTLTTEITQIGETALAFGCPGMLAAACSRVIASALVEDAQP